MDATFKKTLLQRMLVIRAFEETIGKLFYKGQLPGFIHLSIGQEATSVGACAALKETDYIGTTHRGHGHIIAKGVDVNRMMAELFGRQDGFCRGKGGSMHVFDKGKGVLGANGIVGGGIPIVTGGALSAKLEGQGRVAMAFFGDGASNEGAFHEALNLAAVWKLPAIYVCENNQYGEFTPLADATAVTQIAKRAASYDIPGVTVDGNDVEAVYQAASEAVARARAGEGPTLLECVTYRWHGHFHGEEALLGSRSYRPKEEVERWIALCPIARYKGRLLQEQVVMEAEIEQMEKAAQAQVDQAVGFAQNSPMPTGEQALEDVYCL
ncbi:MAG: thiamine pyrophosphate-dependent dehydrogenase E1 component subunit alpha [Acidobacteria bacterium]|nr:thiamine pyrophosphate-dependent dehydrogenase E1 component subunit alpha [Acidobacteriota bacterium]